MARVVLKDVTKVFKTPGRGAVQALAGVSLEIEDKECLVLLGPSGSGKTTLLRLVAGLDEITSGELFLDDERVTKLSPQKRPVAVVFQEPALYPHLSVSENLAFGLRLRGCSDPEIARQLGPICEMLGLTGLLQTRPDEISGGQRQRVALGRALLRGAKIVLLDEPFANLDPRWRAQLRQDISLIRENLGTTLIYVTHDHLEAMLTGDRLAVLRDGRLQQHGSPDTLYRKPANIFVAEFIGFPAINSFRGNFVRRNDQLWFDVVSNLQGSNANSPPLGDPGSKGELLLPMSESWKVVAERLGAGEAVLALRPEDVIRIEPGSHPTQERSANLSSSQETYPSPIAGPSARIVSVKRTGADVFLTARVGKVTFVTRARSREEPVNQGEGYFLFKTEEASLFNCGTGERIVWA